MEESITEGQANEASCPDDSEDANQEECAEIKSIHSDTK